MSIIPRFTGAGLLDYASMAVGLVLGFAIMQQPMDQLRDAIKKA
jgi:hypothetical protein|tara:strand:+ start:272 stop:403 length:132 start_codon:yes stop_codon:yes gene_type:complete